MKRGLCLIMAFILVLGCAFSLLSCGSPNSDAKKTEELLEEKGYLVVSVSTSLIPGVYRSFTATRYNIQTGDVEWVQIFYITETANGVYDQVEEMFLKEKEKEENKDKEIVFGKKEGVVWFGTATAVADSGEHDSLPNVG